jgi:pimeloyl-ACP methyl ester carboxylesterase
MTWICWVAAGAILLSVSAGTSGGAESPRYLIYLHGRIVQERQSARPRHERFGYYELEKILDAFRSRGFIVIGEMRPKSASESESADRVVETVKRLLVSGVPAGRVTVVGASMGAYIALTASARLQNPDLHFAVLGACLSESVPVLLAEEGRKPSGRLLAIREASDEFSAGCRTWKDELPKPGVRPALFARELVLHTGLSHGFLYRPLPEWVDPVARWAAGP